MMSDINNTINLFSIKTSKRTSQFKKSQNMRQDIYIFTLLHPLFGSSKLPTS